MTIEELIREHRRKIQEINDKDRADTVRLGKLNSSMVAASSMTSLLPHEERLAMRRKIAAHVLGIIEETLSD